MEKTGRNLHFVLRFCVRVKNLWAKGVGAGIDRTFEGGGEAIETFEFLSNRSMRQTPWK